MAWKPLTYKAYIGSNSYSNLYNNPLSYGEQTLSPELLAILRRNDNPDDDRYLDKGKRTTWNRAMSVLMGGAYTSAGFVKGAIDPNKGALEGAWEGVKAGNPFGGGYSRGETTYSDVLEELGWKPTTLAGKVVRGTLGFVADVALDPTTYATGGLSAIVRGTGKASAALHGTESIVKLGESVGVKTTGKVEDIATIGSALKDKLIQESVDQGYHITQATAEATRRSNKIMDDLYTSSRGMTLEKAVDVVRGTGLAKTPEEVIKDAHALMKNYNKTLGLRTNVGHTLSLANAPLGKKVFGKLADHELTITSVETLNKIGDATLAPAYAKLRNYIYGSKFGELFSPGSKLYKASRVNPEAVYHVFKQEDMARGLGMDRIKSIAFVNEKMKELGDLGLTPAEAKEVVELMQNKTVYSKVAQSFDFLKSQEAGFIKETLHASQVQKKQEINELLQQKKDLEHSRYIKEDDVIGYQLNTHKDILSDMKREYVQKLLDFDVSRLTDEKDIEAVLKLYEDHLASTDEVVRYTQEALTSLEKSHKDNLKALEVEFKSKINPLKSEVNAHQKKIIELQDAVKQDVLRKEEAERLATERIETERLTILDEYKKYSQMIEENKLNRNIKDEARQAKSNSITMGKEEFEQVTELEGILRPDGMALAKFKAIINVARRDGSVVKKQRKAINDFEASFPDWKKVEHLDSTEFFPPTVLKPKTVEEVIEKPVSHVGFVEKLSTYVYGKSDVISVATWKANLDDVAKFIEQGMSKEFIQNFIDGSKNFYNGKAGVIYPWVNAKLGIDSWKEAYTDVVKAIEKRAKDNPKQVMPNRDTLQMAELQKKALERQVLLAKFDDMTLSQVVKFVGRENELANAKLMDELGDMAYSQSKKADELDDFVNGYDKRREALRNDRLNDLSTINEGERKFAPHDYSKEIERLRKSINPPPEERIAMDERIAKYKKELEELRAQFVKADADEKSSILLKVKGGNNQKGLLQKIAELEKERMPKVNKDIVKIRQQIAELQKKMEVRTPGISKDMRTNYTQAERQRDYVQGIERVEEKVDYKNHLFNKALDFMATAKDAEGKRLIPDVKAISSAHVDYANLIANQMELILKTKLKVPYPELTSAEQKWLFHIALKDVELLKSGKPTLSGYEKVLAHKEEMERIKWIKRVVKEGSEVHVLKSGKLYIGKVQDFHPNATYTILTPSGVKVDGIIPGQIKRVNKTTYSFSDDTLMDEVERVIGESMISKRFIDEIAEHEVMMDEAMAKLDELSIAKKSAKKEEVLKYKQSVEDVKQSNVIDDTAYHMEVAEKVDAFEARAATRVADREALVERLQKQTNNVKANIEELEINRLSLQEEFRSGNLFYDMDQITEDTFMIEMHQNKLTSLEEQLDHIGRVDDSIDVKLLPDNHRVFNVDHLPNGKEIDEYFDIARQHGFDGEIERLFLDGASREEVIKRISNKVPFKDADKFYKTNQMIDAVKRKYGLQEKGSEGFDVWKKYYNDPLIRREQGLYYAEDMIKRAKRKPLIEERDKLITEIARLRKAIEPDDAVSAIDRKIEEITAKMAKTEELLANSDAFETYMRTTLGEDEYWRVIKENDPQMGMLMLDTMTHVDDKVKNAVKLLRDEMDRIGVEEISVGKLKQEQFDAFLGEYLPHIVTAEGSKLFEILYKRDKKMIPSFGKELGYGRKSFNPHGLSRTAVNVFDESGNLIHHPTIEQINEYFKKTYAKILKGNNVFSDNIFEIYQTRAMKNVELMYDVKYTDEMLNIFGHEYKGVQEAGYKTVMNYGKVKEATQNYARLNIEMEISRDVSEWIIKNNIMDKAKISISSTPHVDRVAYKRHLNLIVGRQISEYTERTFTKPVRDQMFEGYAKSFSGQRLSDLSMPMLEFEDEGVSLISKGFSDALDDYFIHIKEKLGKFEVGMMYESGMKVTKEDAELLMQEVKSLDKDAFRKRINELLDDDWLDVVDKERVTSILGKADKLDAVSPLQIRQVSDAITQKANQARKLQIAKDQSRFLQLFDKYTHLIKLNQTTILPYFHTRNKLSNTFLNWLGTGTDAMNPEFQKQAWHAMRKKGDADGVLKITSPDGVVREMSWGEVYKKAEEYGAINRGFYATELGIDGTKKVSNWNPLDAKGFKPYQVGGKVGSFVEGQDRLIHFASQVGQGKSFEEAAESANKFLFDYSDITQFEASVMKRIIPYYTWLRKNGALQLEQMLEQPEKYQMVAKVQSGVSSMTADEDRVNPFFVNDFALDWIQLPFSITNPEGKEEPVLWNPAMPFMDVSRIPNPMHPIDSLKNLFTQSNPLFKVPLEQIANRNVFFDQPIVDTDKWKRTQSGHVAGETKGNQITDRLDHVGSQLGAYGVLSGLNKRGADLGLHVLNSTTGLKMLSYDYDRIKSMKIGEMIKEGKWDNDTIFDKMSDKAFHQMRNAIERKLMELNPIPGDWQNDLEQGKPLDDSFFDVP